MNTLLQIYKEKIEKWRYYRDTVITSPDKIDGESVIDCSAMVKRDEDFIQITFLSVIEAIERWAGENKKLPARESWGNAFKTSDEVLAYNQALSDLLIFLAEAKQGIKKEI
jgi:hypothetical protein